MIAQEYLFIAYLVIGFVVSLVLSLKVFVNVNGDAGEIGDQILLSFCCTLLGSMVWLPVLFVFGIGHTVKMVVYLRRRIKWRNRPDFIKHFLKY